MPNIRSFLFLLREALADAGINTRVGWGNRKYRHGCHQREPLLAEGLVIICICNIAPSFRANNLRGEWFRL